MSTATLEIDDRDYLQLLVATAMRIVIDEYNTDIVGESFYLEPETPIGRFSKAFFLPLMRTFVAHGKKAGGVNRNR